ncbi:hypothetical protein EYZ11_000410 [Aspergillus tanneri]|uniref:Uncharacterized protein n=1 Tax=Aspergillus tanneri TaxID=1220188 RepID=A0A4S3JX47_9EURO|nr:uncharacterized protein ATNIH1004_006825 [Aspergillus tanneri]KAA8645406.1 hypothetical protein ATNIH1004_006825 [Aspergillus tanneri]THD00085.1 hypothetical protein EYZ11_000410 [Aspergillus tanneri]
MDPSSVYLLGADCVDKDLCQDWAFEIEESYDVWIYSLVTEAISEMVSPNSETQTYAKDSDSYRLCWIGGPKQSSVVASSRGSTSDSEDDANLLTGLPNVCKISLTQLIKCNSYAQMFLSHPCRDSPNNDTQPRSVMRVVASH